ncbi:MAG TPA: hypothetical protein VG917_02020 [Patescibacteria group bacterium]|nr:hypothetical protein [Patescibacteria group bacterium]
MRAQRKFLKYLYIFLGAAILLILTIFLIPPEAKLTLFGVDLGAPILMFIVLFITFGCLFTFLFANIRRGILASTFITGTLLLRLFGITSIYQIAILFLILLLIEYSFSRNLNHQSKSS